MQILLWLFRIALFLLLVAFAIKNDGLVRVQAFLDTSWNVPLVVVILVSFIAGFALGAGSLASSVLSLRRELEAAKRRSVQKKSSLSATTPTQLRGKFTDISDSF